METTEKYFSKFRPHIIGNNVTFNSPYGKQKILYADWLAGGRLYKPIEDKIANTFGPFVANTHTETSETGTLMTLSYRHALDAIKAHVNAGENDVIITAGSGMTTVVNKLQRILSLKGCGRMHAKECQTVKERPVVFITHMEHHSNHTSWFETISDVVQLEPDENLLVNPDELRKQLKIYSNRKFKIGAFTSASNVTGIQPPYHELAAIMHEFGGLCFVDFAASAPYIDINMHPQDPMQKLDAIYFSPHKFLGGPGTSGVLIFDKSLYHAEVPDNPGGGTVDWTNRWGNYRYVDDIEVREDGGTPGFLQAIRTALSIELKNQMGTGMMLKREHELVQIALENMRQIPGIMILANNIEDRLGVISFYHEKIHFNLFVKLLNDRFGIQVRGGCACAGTYGHYLLQVSYEKSKEITDRINSGDLSSKPGWIRLSLHPTMTSDELHYVIYGISEIVKYYTDWQEDYIYVPKKNEYFHSSGMGKYHDALVKKWFTLPDF